MSQPSFAHVRAMSDSIGMFEHADHAEPRREHGYCTDDMARLLIVAVRAQESDATTRELGRLALRFLAAAQSRSGQSRNRRVVGGAWLDHAGVEDCWGRSAWAFGSAAAGLEGWMRGAALACFNRAVVQRSSHCRAMAFAALGAAEVIASAGDHRRARELLGAAIVAIGPVSHDPSWPWPEARLTYANGVIPDALIAAGHALGRREIVDDGLMLLGWLLDRQIVDGHLSLVPVDGAGPADPSGRFDQQPIEAAALADACVRAHVITGDSAWLRGVDLAVAWFEGSNDAGAVMWDGHSGGGYDGLTRSGPNLNQGAESTLALISTFQHAHAGRTLAGAGRTRPARARR